MNRTIRLAPVCFVGLLVLMAAFARPVAATTIEMKEIRFEGNRILATVKVPGLLNRRAKARLASGEKFESTLRFYLMSGRDFIPDEQLDLTSIGLATVFNAATEEYTFTRSVAGKVVETRTVRSLDELRDLLELHTDLPIFQADPKRKGEKLFVQVRAYLGTEYLLGVIPTEKWTDKSSSDRFTSP